MIQKPKGTYDLYGEDAKLMQAVEEIAIALAKNYNFSYIRTPMFERSELFHRGVGESSDIVRKETYDFIDKGNRNMTLKPEGTAGVVRSYIENKMYADNQVSKFYYFSPCFRYDRPQAGRFREHRQFGVEVFGSASPYMDAEVISIAVSFYKLLGLKNIKVKINTLGDKKSKENYSKALYEYFSPNIDKLCEDCNDRINKNPLRILDCKVDSDNELLKNAPTTLEYLNEESKRRFEEVKKALDILDIQYEIDTKLVRGLDYYTHTIFEFEYIDENHSAENTIGAGGRYDNLVESLDGPSVPGLGFGIGLERVASTIKKLNNNILEEETADVLVYGFEEVIDKAFELTYLLRMNGFSTEINYNNKNMKQLFKDAEKLNPKYIIIVGSEEIKNNVVKIKNNNTKEEETINIDDIITYLDTNIKE